MAGADFAGVFLVVVEVLRCEHAILVTKQAVAGHGRRIELDLNLHVLGDRHQRAGHLLDEHLLGFLKRVDVSVVAVPLVGELFERRVFQVAHAVAQRAEEDFALGLLFDQPDEAPLVGDADVEIAVGGENHAVDSLGDEVVDGQLVRELNARAAVGGAAGFQTVDRFENRLLAVAAGRRQHETRVARVDHDRHAVAVAQLAGKQLERFTNQRQLVLLLHRAGDVDEKHQVARGPLLAMHFASLQSHAHQHVVAVPRATGRFRGDAKRIVAGRLRIVVGEVVDELLKPHGIRRRQLAACQIPTHVGIARRVDVDGERRERSVGRAEERILRHRVVRLGVHRAIAATDRIDAGLKVEVALVFRQATFQHFDRFRFAPGFRANVGGKLVGELLQLG